MCGPCNNEVSLWTGLVLVVLVVMALLPILSYGHVIAERHFKFYIYHWLSEKLRWQQCNYLIVFLLKIWKAFSLTKTVDYKTNYACLTTHDIRLIFVLLIEKLFKQNNYYCLVHASECTHPTAHYSNQRYLFFHSNWKWHSVCRNKLGS